MVEPRKSRTHRPAGLLQAGTLRKSSRAIGSCFGEENSVESRAELRVDDEPESRRVNACGRYDLDRRPRPVAAEYKKLIREFAGITAVAHGELFGVTDRAAADASDV